MEPVTEPRPVRGALWMMVAGVGFVAMTSTVKWVGSELPAAQIAFLRFAIGLVFVLPLIPSLRAHWPRGRTRALIGSRGVVHTIAALAWFYALTRIPLADVTAMNYMTPVYITIGGALIFREVFGPRRAMALAFAFAGAVIILRPGFRTIEDGHVAMIACSIFMAAGHLIAKRLSGQMPASLVVSWLTITVTICLAPVAIAVWQPVPASAWPWLIAVAAFATLGHYAMTRAFALAPVVATQPVVFLQLVWAVLIGFFLFGEAIDPFVILGGTVIIAAVTYVTLREAHLARVRLPTESERPSGAGPRSS